MNRAARIGFSSTLVFGIFLPIAFAQSDALRITPELVDSSEPVTRALAEHAGYASTAMTGKGQALSITYGSDEPLEIYLVPLQSGEEFVPTDFLRFTLPAAARQDAIIDLTVSPGWRPWETKYLLHLLSKTEGANAGFYDATFVPSSLFSTIQGTARHLFTPEPYTPSSYHALRGYRVLGFSVTIMLGTILLIATLAMIAWKRLAGTQIALSILIGAMFLYGTRFAVDLARMSAEHVYGYHALDVYDEAGSVYTTAQIVQRQGSANPSVYVCRDGTNFREKLLRYFAYPIPISADQAAAKNATLAVVMGKIEWSFEPQDGAASNGRLRCGDIDALAERIATFPDGSELFRIPPSR